MSKQLLFFSNSSKNTPIRKKKDDLSSMEKLSVLDSITMDESIALQTPNAKKTLFQDDINNSVPKEVIPMTPTTQTPRRRSLRLSSIQSLPEITNSHEAAKLTPRRSSIDTNTSDKTASTRRKTIFATSMSKTIIMEEEEDSVQSNTLNTPKNMEESRKINVRRTMFTPRPMDESEEAFLTPTPIVKSRRTLYTPRPMEESFAVETNSIKTPIANSVLDNFLTNNVSFNSTKTPISSKRKTIYEISMDIIDQRLSNINRIAKLNQSMNDTEIIDENLIDNKITNSPIDGAQVRIDSFYKQSNKTNEFLTPKNTKRKLYSIPTIDEIQLKEDVQKSLTPIEKRSRKLNDSLVTHSAGKRFKTADPIKNSRRSSMDFSQRKTDVIKSDLSKKSNVMVFTNCQQTQMNLIQEVGKFKI